MVLATSFAHMSAVIVVKAGSLGSLFNLTIIKVAFHFRIFFRFNSA